MDTQIEVNSDINTRVTFTLSNQFFLELKKSADKRGISVHEYARYIVSSKLDSNFDEKLVIQEN
jgi:hypothetical protein